MRLWTLGALVFSGCVEVVCTPPDASCPTPPDRCTGAAAGFTCDLQGASCGCCLTGGSSCSLLGCDLQPDGGLAWYSYSGVPPPQCK